MTRKEQMAAGRKAAQKARAAVLVPAWARHREEERRKRAAGYKAAKKAAGGAG